MNQTSLQNLLRCNGVMVIQSKSQKFKSTLSDYMDIEFTDYSETVTYSQSYTEHLIQNKTYYITSGHLLEQFLDHKNSEIQQSQLINLINDTIYFSIVKGEEFYALNIVKIFGLEDIPSLNLQKSQLNIILLQKRNQSHSDIRLENQKQIYSNHQIYQGTDIFTISSPFGVLSDHLYLNCVKKTHIAKQFSFNEKTFEIDSKSCLKVQSISLINMITNIGQEGGGVYDEDCKFLGMILPHKNIININEKLYYSYFLQYEIQEDKQVMKKQEKTQEINNVLSTICKQCCIVRQDKVASGTLFTNNSQIFVLSVKHFLKESVNENLRNLLEVIVDGKIYPAKQIIDNISSLDITFLELLNLQKQDLDELIKRSIQISDFLMQEIQIQVQEIIYTVGFGILDSDFHSNKTPLVAKGEVTKLVHNEKKQQFLLKYKPQRLLLFQTNAFVHNGYSGGGVYNSKGNFIGFQSFNLKLKSQIICDINYVYPVEIFKNFFVDLYKSSQINKKTTEICEQLDQQYQNLHTLQTRQFIPDLNPKL